MIKVKYKEINQSMTWELPNSKVEKRLILEFSLHDPTNTDKQALRIQ